MSQIDPNQIRGYNELAAQVTENQTESVSPDRISALFNNNLNENNEEEK